VATATGTVAVVADVVASSTAVTSAKKCSSKSRISMCTFSAIIPIRVDYIVLAKFTPILGVENS
jgi:hypothetical protein